MGLLDYLFKNTESENAATDAVIQAAVEKAIKARDHPSRQTITINSPGYSGPRRIDIDDNGNGFINITTYQSKY